MPQPTILRLQPVIRGSMRCRRPWATALLRLVAASAIAVGTAAPAQADYSSATYTGTIGAVNAGTPASLGVGTPITFNAVYDTGKLVDRTQSVNDATGLGFSSVLTASLSDDPKASMTISVGGVTFSKFDEVNYGTPEGDCGQGCDLGAGNFPVVTYLDNHFAGIGNLFVNADGYSLDADPIADAFGGFDLGSGAGGYDFFLGKVVNGDPFGQVLAVGNYDAAEVKISPVPEPAPWSLMIVGMAALLLTRPQRRTGRLLLP